MRVTLNSKADKPVALINLCIELEFGRLGFVEGAKLENPEKIPQNRDENQQQTQLTCHAWSGNRTRDTAAGGECSPTVPSLHARNYY